MTWWHVPEEQKNWLYHGENLKICFDRRVLLVDLSLRFTQFRTFYLPSSYISAVKIAWFSVGGKFCKQTSGVGKGFLLFPFFASFFVEDCEERAFEQVTHRPLCWFYYVDNTFVVWQHGTEKLERFLDHLNGLHRNILFTLGMEKDGHPFFLDIDIYKRLDDSQGHKVYQKSTLTDLCLKLRSHHHSSNIQAVHSALVHRVLWATKKASWWVGVPQDHFKGKWVEFQGDMFPQPSH